MNENEPLSINLDTTETVTSIPLIKDGSWSYFTLKNIASRSNEKGPSVNFEFDLAQPTEDSTGKQLLPGQLGSKQFVSIALYAKPDAKNPKWFLEKIAKIQDALLGTGDAGNEKGLPTRPAFSNENFSTMIGQTLIAKVKVSTYEGQTRNELAEFKHLSALNPVG